MYIGKPLNTGLSGPLHNGLNLNAQDLRSLLLHLFYPMTLQDRRRDNDDFFASGHVFIYPRCAANIHHCLLFMLLCSSSAFLFSSFV